MRLPEMGGQLSIFARAESENIENYEIAAQTLPTPVKPVRATYYLVQGSQSSLETPILEMSSIPNVSGFA